MSWYHVEDTESSRGAFTAAQNKFGERRVSTKTNALSVWRCGHCRALAVTARGDRPDGACGKCKQ